MHGDVQNKPGSRRITRIFLFFMFHTTYPHVEIRIFDRLRELVCFNVSIYYKGPKRRKKKTNTPNVRVLVFTREKWQFIPQKIIHNIHDGCTAWLDRSQQTIF